MPAPEKDLEPQVMPQVVALVGSPNAGKTTLYNWLTKSQFRTVNYPGATVEYSVGRSSAEYSDGYIVVDTPGIYSLFPKSADEEVTLRVLSETQVFGAVEKVILLVDGTQMERHLFIAKQLQEAGAPFLIVLSMQDLLKKNQIQIDREILQKEFQCPVILFDGVRGLGMKEIFAELQRLPGKKNFLGQKLTAWPAEKMLQTQLRLESLVQKSLGTTQKTYAIYDRTAKMDRFFLHPVLGILIFFALMTLLFSSIFWLAAPFMDGIDQFFSWLATEVQTIGQGALWADFLSEGVIKSFSAVLIFVPQIFILFFGIGLIESSGYLARAATLVDRPFSLLGMSGRSFVPILSSFACAVPAMMATRNISAKRDRFITNFILPLMTCSARLPVYALLLTFLFHQAPAWQAGVILALIYLLSLFLGAIAAAILHRILKRSEHGFFMMELPLYRRPRVQVTLSQSLARTKSYVLKAGPAIFTFALLIWLSSTFPNYQMQNQTEKLQSSYLGKVGQAIEPIFTPMGGDWRVGIGLLSAFAAREVFVSSMAMVFNIQDGNEEAQTQSLLQSMREASNEKGQKIFTFSTVLGLIVFFMIALQCMSTVVISAKENASWKFALGQLLILNGVAYVFSVALVQGLRALGVA